MLLWLPETVHHSQHNYWEPVRIVGYNTTIHSCLVSECCCGYQKQCTILNTIRVSYKNLAVSVNTISVSYKNLAVSVNTISVSYKNLAVSVNTISVSYKHLAAGSDTGGGLWGLKPPLQINDIHIH